MRYCLRSSRAAEDRLFLNYRRIVDARSKRIEIDGKFDIFGTHSEARYARFVNVIRASGKFLDNLFNFLLHGIKYNYVVGNDDKTKYFFG